MNESDFVTKWNLERAAHKVWGDYVVKLIHQELESRGKEPNLLIKIPAIPRLKETASLLDKAFRRGKNYKEPYKEIEDKVGVRFVVLLNEDIELISEIIESNPLWDFENCRNHKIEMRNDPLLFTYQSVHYVLRPSSEHQVDGEDITQEVACEVQIRTLLQHAHAELTHDAIYKSKKVIEPEIHRTVAKSMALIETTDQFFSEVTQKLSVGAYEEFQISKHLDSYYHNLVGREPVFQKSSIIIWDEYENVIDRDLLSQLNQFIRDNGEIKEIISERYFEHIIYQQSVVIFVYWMLRKKKKLLTNNWPFSEDILMRLANDLGVSLGM